MKKIEILGIKIDNITFDQALKVINNFVVLGKPKQIVTVNPEFIVTSEHDEEFKNILNAADLSVPDGAGLIFVSKYILNNPLTERVAGVDLVLAISKHAAEKKYPIFLLGGKESVAEQTANILKGQNPGLIIAGTYAGKPKLNVSEIQDFRQIRMTDIKPKRPDTNLEIIKKIRQAKPKILFVAYGAPKQDKFIARYKKQLNVPVMIGVGGAFDFISGKTRRAPTWIQKIWLEWLWRLIMEPWRWRRIFTATIVFPWMVIKDKFF